MSFSALQRAENSSICPPGRLRRRRGGRFQCSSASRKFLNPAIQIVTEIVIVSVLFSEPKIPQLPQPEPSGVGVGEFQCSSASRKFLNVFECEDGTVFVQGFSALQRAENSSIVIRSAKGTGKTQVSVLFSEPKIPQFLSFPTWFGFLRSFSALQRAENSSISRRRRCGGSNGRFQCSSASRKFLNIHPHLKIAGADTVSVLFSEPKIPQSHLVALAEARDNVVSVLFSEPKIPQSRLSRCRRSAKYAFQCSSASRKFLNSYGNSDVSVFVVFQCSSASRKFLNRSQTAPLAALPQAVSVLFSEPKIPQFDFGDRRRLRKGEFQCSSASRKFLN